VTVTGRTIAARAGGYAPIGDYAAIGDGRTVALVSRDGSIDWLPLPTIDRAAAFAAILDARRGGSFHLRPEGAFGVERRYLDGTNILETTFTSAGGVLRVTDALVMQDGGLLPWVELVRQAVCLAGAVRVRWSVTPRFGFGGEETNVTLIDGVPVALGDRLRVAVLTWDFGTPVLSDSEVAGAADLVEGDENLVALVVTDNEPIPHPPRAEVEARLQGTRDAWRRWLGTGADAYDGPWRPAVERSALALKLLVHAPSGAMAAAATSGLPERIGGDRNYDYRFAWIRDASFALDALSRLGFRDQVHASLSWLLGATEQTHPRLAPLYELDGRVPRGTRELPLDGYRGSRPVQLGNGASTQLQLGNFGDLFDTVWNYVRHGNSLDPATATRLAETASFVCDVWMHEDSGLWELPRNRHYTISKMSCWLALTRAIALAEQGQLERRGVQRWRETAAKIRDFVETRCFSKERRSYTFHADSDDLDCAVLLASEFEYADPRGDRMNGTIDAVRAELAGGGPLLYRYTGMRDQEGCFLACSFWLVSALAKAARLTEAEQAMEELVELANDVGLYSEEIDPASRELLGNFPQALTHLSLIRAATTLADAKRDEGGNR
jgi:GH15 family glucan-1,4-alpha-glucosidase